MMRQGMAYDHFAAQRTITFFTGESVCSAISRAEMTVVQQIVKNLNPLFD
jgi:hypothetical protein